MAFALTRNRLFDLSALSLQARFPFVVPERFGFGPWIAVGSSVRPMVGNDSPAPTKDLATTSRASSKLPRVSRRPESPLAIRASVIARAYQKKTVGTMATSPLFEIARVLVRFDHIASAIVNANHSTM